MTSDETAFAGANRMGNGGEVVQDQEDCGKQTASAQSVDESVHANRYDFCFVVVSC